MRTVFILGLLVLVSVWAPGQQLPFRTHGDFYVVDHGTPSEAIFRFQDLNGDGDVQDLGEQIIFYDLTSPGPDLTNMQAMTINPVDGTVWVSGTSMDIILRLKDMNGDGDANDAGEYKVFYDNTGAQTISSVVGMAFDGSGKVLYLINSGSVDMIVRLEDKDNNGDALGKTPGKEEATVYLDNSALSGSWLVSPSDLVLYKGDLYAVDSSKNVIIHLMDTNNDGDAQDLGEVVQFAVAKSPGTGSTWNIVFDRAGVLYGVELGGSYYVRRWEDKNVNGTAMDPGEASVFFHSANNANNYTTKTSFSLATDSSGSVYVCNHTADTVYKLTDLNSDEDANDTGEAMEYVSNTGSPTTGPPLARALDRGRDCMVGPAGEIIPVAPPKIGTTASWLLDDPLGGSLPYFTALSFGNAGIPLGSPDIRSIPLSLDVLVYMSVNNLLPWLKNFQGVFHSSGQASVQVALPNNPALVNQTINMAFVTLKASEPSGILTVSNPYSFIIQQ